MKSFELKGHARPVQYLQFNTEGDLFFTTGREQFALVWSFETGEMLGSYDSQGAMRGCDVNYTSSMLVTAGADSTAGLWNVRDGTRYATIELETPVQCVRFSHGDTHVLAVTTDVHRCVPQVQLFKLPDDVPASKGEDYAPVMRFENPSSVITFATFGPMNNTIYFATRDGEMKIADVETGQTVVNKKVHDGEIMRFRWDKEYQTPITASVDSTAKLLDSRSLDVIQTYEYEKGKIVFDADIAPKADHVIIAGGDDPQSVTNVSRNVFETRFCHKMTGKTLGKVDGHFGTVNTLAFHPLGKGFVTGAEDSSIRLHHFDDSYCGSPGAEDVRF
ncbi:eukaryotic translation initiation factor 3 subunit [Perkinsela sp. CCAP 1560/4]|nr:eukaryotic translation initiation factor 3 subunit [Perkinsela sp. CCAP 1560/4]KNH08934.1 eukaryotic translation initiation factor 3 subunit [Perkinsela sp. CCAP 1560/4]|eukprot:KNH04300.1 eukaryotic translation initiation factor 3 subunit [Perkinsela sp. CCAP 1560/4]